MRGIVERIARAGHPPLYTLTPAQARVAFEAGSAALEIPKAELPRVQDLRIPARDGAPLPARLYAPSTRAGLPLLLYLHGGGFTVGSLQTHDALCRELARLAGCMVVSLDYRLAPEHKFPAASNDAWDALAWLAAHAADLGADPARLAVGGDSAGGTLAAVNAILARDARLPLALQLLIYPGTAAHADTASHARYAQGPVLDARLIDWFFNHYVSRTEREDWRFAPLRAPDVSGIAPAWIGLAECDPLHDEGVQYADKLRAAGVNVELKTYRGVTHAFLQMGRVLPEARQIQQDAARALRSAFRMEEPA
jgi:acetyl esterase